MADRRDALVTEVWRRLSSVEGMKTTKRNPEEPPEAQDCPVGNIFELDDETTVPGTRPVPTNKQELLLILELFIKGTSAASASKELWVLYRKVMKALYAEPKFLSGKGELRKIRTSRVVTVDSGNHMKGLGIAFNALYIEDIATF